MIEGAVNDRYEAVIALTVTGPSGETLDIEAIIDTGFAGFLTLPAESIVELNLVFEGMGVCTLGDGSEITFPYYTSAVIWDGQPRYGLAEAAETTPLAGMMLLEWHSLHVDVRDGGRVTIEPSG